MKKKLFFGIMLFVLSGTLSAKFSEQAKPFVHAYDYTGNSLTEEQKTWLTANSHNYLQTGKAEIKCVFITNSQFDRYGSIESAALDIFNTWGIGESKEKRNGVLIVVAPGPPGKVRIEVGYDLEKWLNDGRCGSIIRANTGYLKQRQWFEGFKGMSLGVQAVIDRGYQRDSETPVPPSSSRQIKGHSLGFWIIIIFILILLICLVAAANGSGGGGGYYSGGGSSDSSDSSDSSGSSGFGGCGGGSSGGAGASGTF